MKNLISISKKLNFHDYEIPIGIIIQYLPFADEFKTSSGKLLRGAIQKFYQQKMEEIYSNYDKNDLIDHETTENNDFIQFYDSICEKLVKMKENFNYIPQDTSCKDFIDFRFLLPESDADTKNLNDLLLKMIDDVLIIRNEASIWVSESRQFVQEATDNVTKIVDKTKEEMNKNVNEFLSFLSDDKFDNSKIEEKFNILVDQFSHQQCTFVKLFNDLKVSEISFHR